MSETIVSKISILFDRKIINEPVINGSDFIKTENRDSELIINYNVEKFSKYHYDYIMEKTKDFFLSRLEKLEFQKQIGKTEVGDITEKQKAIDDKKATVVQSTISFNCRDNSIKEIASGSYQLQDNFTVDKIVDEKENVRLIQFQSASLQKGVKVSFLPDNHVQQLADGIYKTSTGVKFQTENSIVIAINDPEKLY